MKVTPPQYRKLHRQLQRLTDKLFGRDAEGYSNASVKIHDKQEGRWPCVCPIPDIPYENPTPEQITKAIDAAVSNVESTLRALTETKISVMWHLNRMTKNRWIKETAEQVLGNNVVFGEAFSKYDDAPTWHQWHLYKKADGKRLRTAYLRPDSAVVLEKWLREGKRTLLKSYRNIKTWYIRTDECIGVTLAGLTEIPEKQRPSHIARRRAKTEFLEVHSEEIRKRALAIEKELKYGRSA